mmetsp:Transcript_13792/g.28848  ORF Transcript_13792/g.28848 Transcript_13792/m.28848 type:complete len:423 (-) Transcript_13792:129-1397(-)
MTSSLVTLERAYLNTSFEDGVSFTVHAALAPDNHYTLFRSSDWAAWLTFTTIFAGLIVFDNAVLNRNPQALTISRAVLYTFFWVLCACGFCGWVYWWYGENQAWMWMSGYLLEWMLSFDNLFVFHMIFSVYATPDHLKHKPLYLGICGAVFFRLVFIFVGEYLMHAMFFMHLVFGGFLIYSGIKTVTVDEEDEDPSKHPLVQWLQRKVPFVSCYDDQGAFFVRVPADDCDDAADSQKRRKSGDGLAEAIFEADPIAGAEAGGAPEKGRYGTIDFQAAAKRSSLSRGQLRATMLFLVVLCLEISDMLFAVDSVSAIVAQVNDLFLAYTSAVFAMLGLRATFFIIDVLVRLFSLLKYGVSAVLIFIGVKLLMEHFYHIPPGIVCIVLFGCIGTSMVASVIQDRMNNKDEEKAMEAESAVETAAY